MATIALSPWIPVLIRALKGAQEGQLQPGLVSECRAVLASRIAKYGTRLTSQVRTKISRETDTDRTLHEARTSGADRPKATGR